MHIRLEKFNHNRRQKRYYALHLTETLFGEYCLVREWGVIDGVGQETRTYLTASEMAVKEIERVKTRKLKDGYAVIPVQLGMFS